MQIAKGSVCLTAGLLRFETKEDAVLPAGALSVDVAAQAAETGPGGNVPQGMVRVMSVAPLGIDGCTNPEPFTGGAGVALDLCANELEEIQEEMNFVTAKKQGLQHMCSLLRSRPMTENTEQMRASISALLRIGDRSFTLQAIEDNLSSCGLSVSVFEGDTPGCVTVTFPGVVDIPQNFLELQKRIEEILPCHIGFFTSSTS